VSVGFIHVPLGIDYLTQHGYQPKYPFSPFRIRPCTARLWATRSIFAADAPLIPAAISFVVASRPNEFRQETLTIPSFRAVGIAPTGDEFRDIHHGFSWYFE